MFFSLIALNIIGILLAPVKLFAPLSLLLNGKLHELGTVFGIQQASIKYDMAGSGRRSWEGRARRKEQTND